MKMETNAKRNRDICKLLDTKKVSYGVIAQMMGTTRAVVAGVAFRHHHPYINRKHSLYPTKTGTGWQPATYYPKKTLIVSL